MTSLNVAYDSKTVKRVIKAKMNEINGRNKNFIFIEPNASM